MNNTLIETLDTDYNRHLDTCTLTHAIQDQAFIRIEAAAHLAAQAVEHGYTGGAVVAGVGEYGMDTALYTVIWQAAGQWQMWAGYRTDDGRWHTVDCGQHRDVKTLRWQFGFTYSGRLADVLPAEVQL